MVVSELLDILENISVDNNSYIVAKCKPVSTDIPRDAPEIGRFIQKHWLCKIYLKEPNRMNPITDWFTIPYENIEQLIGGKINGKTSVRFDMIQDDEKTEFFSNSVPTMSIDDQIDRDTYQWLHGLSD